MSSGTPSSKHFIRSSIASKSCDVQDLPGTNPCRASESLSFSKKKWPFGEWGMVNIHREWTVNMVIKKHTPRWLNAISNKMPAPSKLFG